MTVSDSDRILVYLKKYGKVNTFRLSRELGMDRQELIDTIKELESKGVVEFKAGTVKFGMQGYYTNIPLPEELSKQIERVIKIAKWGYKTKSEFVKEAVREKLIRLSKLNLK